MAAIKKSVQKVVLNKCENCRKNEVARYRLHTSNTLFCSEKCIKSYFNNLEKINYESFKCND
jgi:hypothetical protein